MPFFSYFITALISNIVNISYEHYSTKVYQANESCL